MAKAGYSYSIFIIKVIQCKTYEGNAWMLHFMTSVERKPDKNKIIFLCIFPFYDVVDSYFVFNKRCIAMRYGDIWLQLILVWNNTVVV